jgi:hypothetical protein
VAELEVRAVSPSEHGTTVNERDANPSPKCYHRAWICTNSSAEATLRERGGVCIIEQRGQGDAEVQRKIARQAAPSPAVKDGVNCAECASGKIVSTGCANAE